MFPHQGKKPDAAFANPEIGGGEGHLRIFRLLIALGRVFRLPAEQFTLPVFVKRVKMVRKCFYFLQIGNSQRKDWFIVRVCRDFCLTVNMLALLLFPCV